MKMMQCKRSALQRIRLSSQWTLCCTLPKGCCGLFACFCVFPKLGHRSLFGYHCPLVHFALGIILVIDKGNVLKQLQCCDSEGRDIEKSSDFRNFILPETPAMILFFKSFCDIHSIPVDSELHLPGVFCSMGAHIFVQQLSQHPRLTKLSRAIPSPFVEFQYFYFPKFVSESFQFRGLENDKLSMVFPQRLYLEFSNENFHSRSALQLLVQAYHPHVLDLWCGGLLWIDCLLCHGIPQKLQKFPPPFRHPYLGIRIGEAKNPGPNNGFLLKCCLINPTAIYNKVDLITSFDSQIFQIAENSATAAIQIASQTEFKRRGYQTHWSPSVAAHAGVAQEETSFRGQASGVSMHSMFPIRSSRVKLPSDIDHTRLLSSIVQVGTWKIHFLTIYGYPSCHQKSKDKTNGLLQAAETIISQVNLPTILAGDFNHPLDSLAAGQNLFRNGFVSLHHKFTQLYEDTMPHTCRDVTSPDQVVVSADLQAFVTAIEVDKQKNFSDHDPILYQLLLPVDPPMKTSWRLPQSWLPFQPDPDIFEQQFHRLALQNNLPLKNADVVEIPPLPDALELWARVAESAVDATIRQQHQQDPQRFPQKHLPKKCRGRLHPRKIKQKPFGDVIRSACQGQYDPPGEAVNIQLKLVVRQTRRVQSLYFRMEKILRTQPEIHSQQLQQLMQEWKAITTAKGFGPSFPRWCCQIPELNFYPIVLPSVDFLLDLSQFLRLHADNLSYQLQRFRADKSKFHCNNLELVHERSRVSKATKGSQFPMVDSVLKEVSANISEVRSMQGLLEVDIQEDPHFRLDTVMSLGTSVCDPIDQQGNTLTLIQRSVEDDITSFSTITQRQWIHDPKQVAESLHEFWNQFWNRDATSQPDRTDFMTFLQDTPSLDPIDIILDDPTLWQQAAKLMKSRSARGVDGFLVDELKTLPLSAFQALSQIFARSPSQSFGHNLAQVITLPLAKVEDPSLPSQTRPITLVAVLYRLWAKVTSMQVLQQWKDVIPDYIIGFLPGRSPEIEMMKQQHLFELSHSAISQENDIWQGVTLDLIKCFNLIGRTPAALALLKSGIPTVAVETWQATLSQQTRLWKVSDCLFEFGGTTTGTPEGDSWSVLACVALARVWAHHVSQIGAFPSCYADNWSFKTIHTHVNELAIDLTIKCARAMMLLIDWTKTWCWRTSNQGKQQWKNRIQALFPQGVNIHIVRAARELGYTMAYNKVQSRQTQRQRHDDAIRRIHRLRKVKTNLAVKAQICADACLHKALFATHTYHVGNPWIKELRTLIAKTLVPDRKNSNPYLATQLISSFVRDPELHLIIESIRHVRRFLCTISSEQQQAFFYFVSRHTGIYHEVFGPAGALRANLLRIGWQIDKHGWMIADTQVQFHLLQDNLPEIITFVEHCWMKHVMQCRITRKDWVLFPTPDRVATLKLMEKMTFNQQQVLAAQITGAYMLGQQKTHIEDADEKCALCGQPEDIFHRILDCPELQHVRQEHLSMVEYLQTHSNCHLYLPVVYQHEDYEFNTWLFRQLPEPELLDDVLVQALQEIERGIRPTFWTDGSCNTPSNPASRRAAFGIVYHSHVEPHQIDDLVRQFRVDKSIPTSFQVLGSSPCIGAQTIPRAELLAVLILIKHVDSAVIYTDSQYVIDQAAKIGFLLDQFKAHRLPNFDLLSQLWNKLQTGDFVFRKVKSHSLNLEESSQEIFKKLGNEAADKAANWARHHFEKQCPPPAQLERREAMNFAKANLDYRYHLQVERAKLIAVRQHANKPLCASKDFQTQLQLLSPTLEETWVFEATHEDFQAVKSCLWGTQYAIQILKWLQTLQWPVAGTQPTIGISWYELACNFIMVSQSGLTINTGGTGNTFQPRRLCATTTEIHFSKQVFSFERAITNIQAILQRQILPMDRAIATSVRLLGLPVGKSGLALRPVMCHQSELINTLVQHFSRGEIPPEVPLLPIKRAMFDVELQEDDLEHQNDWTKRITVHNRERKRRRQLALSEAQ